MDLSRTRNQNRNKMESQKFSQTQYKIMQLIFFMLHFFNHILGTTKLMKLTHFSLKKLDFFPKLFFGNCFLWSRYGARTGTPELVKSRNRNLNLSTQNQCYRSGMFIPDPGSWFLPILDPGSRIQKQQQKRVVKKISCHNILCSHKFKKNWKLLKKKIWANFQRIIELFSQKIVTKL